MRCNNDAGLFLSRYDINTSLYHKHNDSKRNLDFENPPSLYTLPFILWGHRSDDPLFLDIFGASGSI